MKRLTIILAFFWIVFAAAAVNLTPFVYYGTDPRGFPLTNAITIQPWPATNTIVGVQTNLVGNIAYTFQPDVNGYVSNRLAAGNYRMTIVGLSRGVTFGLPDTNSVVNLAQVSGVPVVTFLNFTIAQFSDAGSSAYSNASAFFPAGLAGSSSYSNASAFLLSYQTNQPLSQITNAGTASYSNASAFLLASISQGATNSITFYTSNATFSARVTNVITFTNGTIKIWTQ